MKKKKTEQKWTLKEVREAWRLYVGEFSLPYKFAYALKKQKRLAAAQQATASGDK